jgi:hypothetical protein
MRHVIAAAAVLLAGCGPAETQQAAQDHASAITKAEVAAANGGVIPTGTTPLKGDGPGCKDRAEAAKLVTASKGADQSEYIRLWADGMQDQRCRGFSMGLGVTVKEKAADGWACILPADDPQNPTCFWIAPGRV